MRFFRPSIQKSFIGKCCRTCCFVNYFVWRLVYKTTRAKAQKALGNFGELFFTEPWCGIFHILYNVLLEGLVQKRVGTYSARVHNGNINGLLSTWKVLMEKKIYLLVGLIFMFLKNTCFSLFVRTNLLARLKLKNQLMSGAFLVKYHKEK